MNHSQLIKRPKLIKRIIFVTLTVCIIALLYQLLSTSTRHRIDKSVRILAPTSPKSLPERYGLGYQPALRYSESRPPCAQQYPNKKALFGDLHIHTALSTDAYPDGTRSFPTDAYQFAKGNAVTISNPSTTPITVQLQRPLDFAAVTDHAETLGEGYICRTPNGFAGFYSSACETYRNGGEDAVREFMSMNAKVFPTRNQSVCGKNNKDCIKAEKIVWQSIIDAAESAYDTSTACRFTSFIGYEYTRSPNGQHLHRNTIFNNASVPPQPATFFNYPNTYSLLQSLEQDCRLNIKNCDAISIPHNTNLSAGNAFSTKDVDGFDSDSQQAYWKLRNSFDRLMEIMQHKGASECLNGATDILGDVDELCNIEAIRQFGKSELAVELNTYLLRISRTNSPECSDDYFNDKHNLYNGFCLSSRDFARGALLSGMKMQHQQTNSINPFEFGFIGSSDTHLGLSGSTNEQNWQGHIAYETDLQARLKHADLGRFNRLISNPGGLVGVYALENSRDAIFQSMKRRETFATSGTRIKPRLFVGNYDYNLCKKIKESNDDSWLTIAYQKGTPMGTKLTNQQLDLEQKPFQLLAYAQQDELSNPLQRLQLIKGWVDNSGQQHSQVIDLVGNEDENKGNDNANGDQELCMVFRDLEYNRAYPTYYYLRAIETPSMRWSHRQCQALPSESRPKNCDNQQPEMIREMAWTSPIWLIPTTSLPQISQ